MIPHITIITPTYNRKELLEKAILSIIHQKQIVPFEREMIIVDDWSTDGTKEYVQHYVTTYSKNITYISQKNAWVWAARNTAIRQMNKNSTYVTFLDSDDELMDDCLSYCLERFNAIREQGDNKIAGLYYLCKDETWKVIGGGMSPASKERILTYDQYLRWGINVEMWFFMLASFFLQEPHLHYPEDVVTEWIMRGTMRKYTYEHQMSVYILKYVWRLYRRFHTSFPPITKTISPERCRKNAIWNEYFLASLWDEFLKRGLLDIYADYLFRIGINYTLAGDTQLWRRYLRKSTRYAFSFRSYIILALTYAPRVLLRRIYSWYIHAE